MKAENVKRALMVIIGKLSPFVKASISQMESQQKVEVFQEQELLVNITKHALVPEHNVLTDSEKKTLLEQYKLTEAQLPKILVRFSFQMKVLMLTDDGSCCSVFWTGERSSS